MPKPEESDTFALPTGTPVIEIVRTAYTAAGLPVENQSDDARASAYVLRRHRRVGTPQSGHSQDRFARSRGPMAPITRSDGGLALAARTVKVSIHHDRSIASLRVHNARAHW
jgi:hypothetical protein